jgi:hypothetical protein
VRPRVPTPGVPPTANPAPCLGQWTMDNGPSTNAQPHSTFSTAN